MFNKHYWHYLSVVFITVITTFTVSFGYIQLIDERMILSKNGYERSIQSLVSELNQLKTTINSQQNKNNGLLNQTIDEEMILFEIKQISQRIEKLHPITNKTNALFKEEVEHQSINSQDPMELAESNHYAQVLGNDEWAAEAVLSIRQAVSLGEIAGARLNDIDCRATSCKIDIGFEDSNQIEPSIDQVTSKIYWDHQHMLKMNDRGFQIIFSKENELLNMVSSQKLE